ncbi:hypothetical protein [Ramlibacter rhizophilus]|uniref:Uncharacterized protein n=1 Tax=Ramlibacter rhizophilus TaxID=1781167 RepID=A0A4Z0C135_9BURK|nr:hypothetical protein [Ramlibacter rhizophilus]TFZ04514.1 hypothetical protein EZ242_01830 [Ramlibacter rhizophilus]
MNWNDSKAPASPIQMREIDADEPVVFLLASAAPVDGRSDAERVNTFAVAPTSDHVQRTLFLGGCPWPEAAVTLQAGKTSAQHPGS